MNIRLSWEEVLCGAQVGLRREVKALARGHEDAYGWKRDGWRQHIEGACAELAVSRALDLSWSGIPLATWHGPDVGADIQVRYRPNPDQPDLGLRPTDDPSHRYILVHGSLPDYELVGWCYGHEHMTDTLQFVTEGDLHGFEEWRDDK
jgi:hypothetical protein